jgi:Carbonic anhydrases/acetyltransferases, isoleucine patch superfamily
MSIRRFEDKVPQIASSAYVDETALVIGDVTIGEDASLWPMVVARGDVHSIRIGARTNIQDGSILHVTHEDPFTPGGYACQVGEDVTVGHRVTLHACTVEDRCLIGMGATVMDGAIIHREVILAAGSLVPPGKELESGHLWVGRPAKKMRPLTEEELKHLSYSAQRYIVLKNRYQALKR